MFFQNTIFLSIDHPSPPTIHFHIISIHFIDYFAGLRPHIPPHGWNIRLWKIHFTPVSFSDSIPLSHLHIILPYTLMVLYSIYHFTGVITSALTAAPDDLSPLDRQFLPPTMRNSHPQYQHLIHIHSQYCISSTIFFFQLINICPRWVPNVWLYTLSRYIYSYHLSLCMWYSSYTKPGWNIANFRN